VGRDNGLWLLLIYLFLSVYILPMYPHGGSANELTRWATAASLVERGSFEVSWTQPLIGPNVDTARVGDKVYSNKAPGTAVISAPIYAITRLFIGPPDVSNIRISWFAMRFFIATLPILLLGVWLYARETDELSLAVLFFASPLFLYSLLFFSHVFVAVILYFAFRFIYDQRYVMPWHCLLSGALAGMAVISEFTAVFPAAVFGFGLLFADRRERLKRPLYFILGGLPFAMLLLWYNYALFGSPFSLSYAHESFPEWAQIAGQGAFGIGLPSFYNVYLLLLSPSRGLFFTAPVLLLSVLTFFTSRESHTLRHRVKMTAILVTVIILSGHGAAHGGWAFGPRYLIIIIPLLMDSFFDGETYEMSNLWHGFLFGLSFIFCVLPALTFPFAPPEFSLPHRDLYVPFLLTERWFVPNLANVVGTPSNLWSMVPILAVLILAIFLVFQNMRRRRRFLAGLTAAVLAAGSYLFIPSGTVDAESEFRRATIAERFFKPAGRLEKFREQAVSSGNIAFTTRFRQAEWMIADARGFAPNDFPYLEPTPLTPGPTQLLKNAAAAQPDNLSEIISSLQAGIARFPFARCELGANLAVIFYNDHRLDEALVELESVETLVDRDASAVCMRSQYLLGTLYRELGRDQDSARAFGAFLSNSQGTSDPELIGLRNRLAALR
jgi:hypothetical protein